MSMARNRKPTRSIPQLLRVWQWNCRGYRRKRGALTQFLATQPNAPDIIALQEVQCTPTLSGYNTYADTTNNIHRIAQLHITVIEHTLQSSSISHVLLELVPCSRSNSSLYVLNVYSAPNARKDDFGHLFAQLCKLGKHILIVGDFNAPHTAWRYATETPKGRRLVQALAVHRMTLLTEPDQPTRLGNSVSRDTCPDLTIVKGVSHPSWCNLMVNLGSDHNILTTELQVAATRARERIIKITNWDAFRRNRTSSTHQDSLPLEAWIKQLQSDFKTATKCITATTETPDVDRHLLHLWDAHRGLTRRWRRQKHNRKLLLRISQLAIEANDYANTLTSNNWHNFWDRLNGTLSTPRTWRILRALINPTQTKTHTANTIRTILRKSGLDDATILHT